MESRIKLLQDYVNEAISKSDNPAKFYAHSHGVAAFCALLAKKRGLDGELACAMGLLHDIFAVVHGTYENHDIGGAEMSKEILEKMGNFSNDEIEIIFNAIVRHDMRDIVHEPYDEVLKDADILCPYFTNMPKDINPVVAGRLKGLLNH
ncbi:MAG: HD domain-containing protein [Defluviitaleaceae bacterium]|nr:HD domain-containing protein [Defluviitaleaceae bacterium]